MNELAEFIRRDRAWHPPADTPGYKSTTLRAPRRALVSLP
jgi:protocatechuate 3,4-dioxygenase beta subunit